MSNSQRIGLPFLDAAQAQKHVTVNEALARLDVVAAGQVQSVGQTTPPATPVDGEAHIIAATGAAGAWLGHEGEMAVYLNGGWDFIVPWSGWRVWVEDPPATMVFDGIAWVMTDSPVSSGGATTALKVVEVDHALSAGATSETAAFIPDKAIVLGATARVIAEIGGATGWSLGVSGSPDRYGSGFGVGLGSWAHGVSGSPSAYYGGTTLVLTASGGDFTGGTVRLAVHYLEIAPPRAI